jgi:beta-xylosidase
VKKAGFLVGLLGCLALSLAAAEDELLLFCFFRGNGEDGVFLAMSEDGLQWTTLNNDQPILRPEVGESKLTRDPSITRGPDGVFHMVWTTSWEGRTIGYASSRDLAAWSPQRAIEVFPDEQGVLNCWAPEVFYDQPSGEFIVVWASTIKGRFPETFGKGTRDYNHRQYFVRTRDFETISKPALFYDPGFQVIDAAIFALEGRGGMSYGMVVKNETLTPPAKYLFLTFADSLAGPWTPPTHSISGNEWAEGASPVRIGGAWYIYFDKYRQHTYGAIRSNDLKHWEDITDKVSMPDDARHGTVFRAPRSAIAALQSR